jgi:hypothetical protein
MARLVLEVRVTHASSDDKLAHVQAIGVPFLELEGQQLLDADLSSAVLPCSTVANASLPPCQRCADAERRASEEARKTADAAAEALRLQTRARELLPEAVSRARSETARLERTKSFDLAVPAPSASKGGSPGGNGPFRWSW